jgi:signal transduction histidine kinase
MPAQELFTRVRAMDRDRLDLVLGLALGVEMQVEASFVPGSDARTLVIRALLLLLAAAFAVRRRFPLASLVAAQVTFVGVQSYDQAVTNVLYVPLFLVLFLNVSAAINTDGRRFWLVPAITLTGGAVGVALDDYDSSIGDALWIVVIFTGLTAAVGRMLRNRFQLQAALEDKRARVERERIERRQAAAVEERERIASDLHDIIAHALSGMVVQASAARRLADRGADADLRLAREAFGAIEDTGRESLAELRRLLGVLRREDEDIALAPAPSLEHLEALAARVRAAGLPVDVRLDGTPVVLPAGVDLTAYRVVQDALREALEDGAAGRAEVRVRYEDRAVALEVCDDGLSHDGAGPRLLLGMRERVQLMGGELTAGTPRDGGHRIRVRLPFEAAVT